MISIKQRGGGLPLRALTLGLGVWISAGVSASAQADGPIPGAALAVEPNLVGSLFPSKLGLGGLGYGPPGLQPGFSGFGLGFHKGYGYGGYGLGVGPNGGYPFYGGPGYPHGSPRLRRFSAATPFPYYGGPGDACHGPTQRYQPTGPLVVAQPVAHIDDESHGDFGPYSGVLPYPETVFAPYASAAAATGSSVDLRITPPPGAAPGAPPDAVLLDRPTTSTSTSTPTAETAPLSTRELGFEQELSVDAGGSNVMKVSHVYPGAQAEKVGLSVGDVIRSINGYRIDQPGNLPWIIDNAAPDHVLKITFRSALDGEDHTVSINLP